MGSRVIVAWHRFGPWARLWPQAGIQLGIECVKLCARIVHAQWEIHNFVFGIDCAGCESELVIWVCGCGGSSRSGWCCRRRWTCWRSGQQTIIPHEIIQLVQPIQAIRTQDTRCVVAQYFGYAKIGMLSIRIVMTILIVAIHDGQKHFIIRYSKSIQDSTLKSHRVRYSYNLRFCNFWCVNEFRCNYSIIAILSKFIDEKQQTNIEFVYFYSLYRQVLVWSSLTPTELIYHLTIFMTISSTLNNSTISSSVNAIEHITDGITQLEQHHCIQPQCTIKWCS